MTERLKQIWSGFEGKTTRRLTGGGVENIATPHRRAFGPPESAKLPADYQAPAEAAFATLRAQLAAGEAKARKAAPAQDAEPGRGRSFADPAADLIRALEATEIRTERPDADYGAFLAANAGRKLKSVGKRRKIFGIF